MPTLEAVVILKQDGQILPGYPISRKVTVDETQQFAVESATGGGYVTLPITSLDQVNALVLQPTQQVTVRFSAQSDQGLILNAGALLVIIDSAIAAAAATNVTANNGSGSTAVLSGLAGGT